MNRQVKVCIVAGLGNPGKEYIHTRHNLGARVVSSLAEKHAQPLYLKNRLSGKVATISLSHHRSCILFCPKTYMNESGLAIRRVLHFYQAPLSSLLIVSDDITTPLCTLKYQPEGGARGHNGMKSIHKHLGSTLFPRLRLGIGDRNEGSLEEHVLGIFSEEEEKKLETFIQKAIEEIERWVDSLMVS